MRHGSEKERLFCRLISRTPEIVAAIKSKYQIPYNFIEAHTTGGNLRKSDAILAFEGNYSLGVNIKSGSVDFNQVTRVWLRRLSEDVGLSATAEAAVQYGVDNHRLKRSKIFIEEQYRDTFAAEIKGKLHNIMAYIFAKNHVDFVKILALYDTSLKTFSLYDMRETIDRLASCVISYSNHGVVKIGNYMTLQRKGGDGGYLSAPKEHPDHPGNQLQFKMKINSYMRELPPFAKIGA